MSTKSTHRHPQTKKQSVPQQARQRHPRRTGAAVIETMESRLLFAAGQVDLGFGTRGHAFASFDSRPISDGYAIAVQPDGKILVGGSTTVLDPDFDQRLALARYNPNGTLDTTFGSGGRVVTDLPGNTEEIRDIAVQPDGKIVVAVNNFVDFAVVRYNANGTLDSGFGSGGRAIFGNFNGANLTEYSEALTLQADGKIVVVGIAHLPGGGQHDFAVARLTTSGALDSSFSGDGKLSISPSVIEHRAAAETVDIAPDGDIVVGGYAQEPYVRAAFVRLDSAGNPDASFSGDGRLTVDIAEQDRVSSLQVQPDGKIVAAGSARIGTSNFDFAVLRVNANGTLDSSFSGDGIATTDFWTDTTPATGDDHAEQVLLQPDGKIIAVGWSASPFLFDNVENAVVMARYNTNGSIDTTFGPSDNGEVISRLGMSGGDARAAAFDAQGRIVIAGEARDFGAGPQTQMVVARFAAEPANGMFPKVGNLFISQEGSALTMAPFGSFVPAGRTIAGYQWDLNYDGQTFDVNSTSGSTITVTTFANDGPTARFVALRIVDNLGNVSDPAVAEIHIRNWPPTATFSNSGPVTAGSTATVSFTNVSDLSGIDQAAGFLYSYDFNNDGTYEIVNSASPTATVPASYLATAGTRIVRGRISDDDGGSTVYTTTITVNPSNNTPITLAPLADTYVRDGTYASTNYGASTALQLKWATQTSSYNRDIYLRFDLSSIANISGATLRLYGRIAEGSASIPVAVYGSSNTSWTEGGINWNNKPATSGTAIATTNVNSTANRYWEWDVSSYLAAEKAAGRNQVTLVLKATTQTSVPWISFNSDESGSNRPQLVVTSNSTPPPPPPQAIVVSPTSLSVPEQSERVFTVRLAAQPSSNVTVNITRRSGSDTDLSAHTSTLTFTPQNWSTGLGVSIGALNDLDTTNGSAIFDLTSAGLATQSVTATEADNDTPPPPQLIVVSTGSLNVNENGSGSFTVRLGTQPAGNVAVNVTRRSGGDTSLGSNIATLTFTPNNWNVAQTVQISAAEDADSTNGSAIFDLTSTDVPTQSVAVTEVDNDATTPVNVTLAPVADSYVRDGTYATTNYGASTALQLKWATQTSNYNREVYLRFDLSNIANISSATLRVYGRIAESSGSIPVSVYGSTNTSWTEGGINWNNKPATSGTAIATTNVNSTSNRYWEWNVGSYLAAEKAAGRNLVTLVLKANTQTQVPWISFNSDESSSNKPQLVVSGTQGAPPPPPQGIVISTSATAVDEGSSSNISVRLAAKPEGNVIVSLTKDPGGDGDLFAGLSSLTFTPENWDTPQIVRIAASEDADAINGAASWTLSSAGMPNQILTVTEIDDDVPAAPTTLRPVADTYVRDGTHANTANGSSSALQLKWATQPSSYNREIYLRFDLSNISTVNDATLRLWGRIAESSGSIPVSVYAASNTSWSEGTTTWNNKPATTGPALATTTITATSNQWHEWDLTSYLAAEKAAGRNLVTLVLRADVQTQVPWLTFNSDEAASNRPELVIG